MFLKVIEIPFIQLNLSSVMSAKVCVSYYHGATLCPHKRLSFLGVTSNESESNMAKNQEIDQKLEAEVQRQYEILSFGAVEIIPQDEFRAMLRDSIKNKKPLRVKCGIDPTGADIHLGHTIPYRKMRQFQDLGHIGIVIIGDYTASIGDPTGRNESRPPLSAELIQENTRKYMEQLYTVIDKNRTEVHFQSQWFGPATLRDVLAWAAQTTVAKLMSHDTFSERLAQGHSLALHELFYPVLQGIDSVYIKADVELGGTDQKFNVLMGRDYQRQQGQRPQVAILLPIITGTCGTQKMSKSLGNTIRILDEPFDQFGKIMSIPDALMLEYYQYLIRTDATDFEKVKHEIATGQLHPNEAKKRLASAVVAFFHGVEVGQQMRQQFEAVFAKGGIPDDTIEVETPLGTSLLDFLQEQGLVASKAEARRLITQNAVSFHEGEKIQKAETVIDSSFKGKVLKVGKRRFIKLK